MRDERTKSELSLKSETYVSKDIDSVNNDSKTSSIISWSGTVEEKNVTPTVTKICCTLCPSFSDTSITIKVTSL